MSKGNNILQQLEKDLMKKETFTLKLDLNEFNISSLDLGNKINPTYVKISCVN